MQLQTFFIQNPRLAIAYSGGADSSYLLYAAKTAGCDVRAYFIKTQFQPEFEIDDAKHLAGLLNVPLIFGSLDVLSCSGVAQNPTDRCYHCKKAILAKLWELAHTDGVSVLCDGTNADDDETDRLGMRALREQGVISPMRDCGLTKTDIRRLSKQAGLFTHDKPAYACLATRIPTGTMITEKLLEMIGYAENALFDIGFSDFRVRVIPLEQSNKFEIENKGKQEDKSKQEDKMKQKDTSCAPVPDLRYIARIQMPEDQWYKAATRRTEIQTALRPAFNDIVLDLKTR